VEQEAFNASYYSTAAQIIPVFFLAAVVAGVWPRTSKGHLFLHMQLLAVVFVSFAGEVTALWALDSHQNPSHVEDWIVSAGFALPALYVTLNHTSDPFEAVLGALGPRRRRAAGVVGQAIFYGTLWVAFSESFNPGIVLAAVGAIFFFWSTVAGRAAEKRRD
jgi:hypothetical protein